VVVPNGTLFGDGISAVIKEEMLKEFRLHTIVRLPQGVFAPYTDIPANLLFFERGGPTDTIWYYELPLPEGRKKYSKTAALQFEEFAPALAWWNAREEGPHAWKVDFAARRAAAVEAATPHWQRAESERKAALALGKPIRETGADLQAAANGDKVALQEQLRTLKAGQQAHEQAAKGRAGRRRRAVLADLQPGPQEPSCQGRPGTRRSEGSDRLDAQPRGRGHAPPGRDRSLGNEVQA
jgi:type I restriction enzyme M protein